MEEGSCGKIGVEVTRRSITLYFPPRDAEWYRAALEDMADALIMDEEAGQRGARVSIFLRMILTAAIVDREATVEALRTIKRIAMRGTAEAEAD